MINAYCAGKGVDSWKFLACISTVHPKWRGTCSSLQKKRCQIAATFFTNCRKTPGLKYCLVVFDVNRRAGETKYRKSPALIIHEAKQIRLNRVVPKLNSLAYTSYQPGCIGVLVQAVIVALIDTIPGKDHRPVEWTPPMLELLPDLIGFIVLHGDTPPFFDLNIYAQSSTSAFSSQPSASTSTRE